MAGAMSRHVGAGSPSTISWAGLPGGTLASPWTTATIAIVTPLCACYAAKVFSWGNRYDIIGGLTLRMLEPPNRRTSVMSLRPPPIAPIPEQTARVAHAAFPKGHPYLTLRDHLGTIFQDEDFAAHQLSHPPPAFPHRLSRGRRPGKPLRLYPTLACVACPGYAKPRCALLRAAPAAAAARWGARAEPWGGGTPAGAVRAKWLCISYPSAGAASSCGGALT